MKSEECSFKKEERIVSQKVIDELFGGGNSHSMSAYPLRAVYMLTEATDPNAQTSNLKPQTSNLKPQILVSVPKKRFHHAVDRNRVKRQLREAYRKHKLLLWDKVSEGKQLSVAFIWMSDQHAATAEIDRRMVLLLHRIAEKIADKPTDTDR